ncbi:hypothetical protein ACJX0J_016242, partial [Zea mays]
MFFIYKKRALGASFRTTSKITTQPQSILQDYWDKLRFQENLHTFAQNFGLDFQFFAQPFNFHRIFKIFNLFLQSIDDKLFLFIFILLQSYLLFSKEASSGFFPFDVASLASFSLAVISLLHGERYEGFDDILEASVSLETFDVFKLLVFLLVFSFYPSRWILLL